MHNINQANLFTRVRLQKKYSRVVGSSENDFNVVLNLIKSKSPFVFIRFSDGEMEIIRNRKLEINEYEIIWSKGRLKNVYPSFDFKLFDPKLHIALHADLVKSAEYTAGNFIKGVPTRHNNAKDDRDLMIKLNGDSRNNLTFADLFLNENFIKFRKKIIPLLLLFPNIYYLGNFRANPKAIDSSWHHIKVPDNVFQEYSKNKEILVQEILSVPVNSLILLSASSMSNILAFEVCRFRKDLTFIDVGTSLHDLVELKSGIREYHILLEKHGIKNILKILRYKRTSRYKLKW
jgi:hypothetical protein